MIIYYYPRFRRSFKSLDRQLQIKAEARIRMFRNDPFDIRLATHHLTGKLKRLWSFSIDSRFRILFEFLTPARDEVVFLDIGSHDIYR